MLMRFSLCVCLFAVSVSAEVVERLPEVKTFHLTTALAADGEPACLVAVPDGSAGERLGIRVADSIAAACGVRPPVKRASEVTAEQLAAQNVVALGVFCTNQIVNRLYLREWVLCDYSWPQGEASYVIRTVHDPWLSGTNVVYIGGTTEAGLTAAVERFGDILGELPAGGQLPALMVVADQDGPSPLDEAALAKTVAGIEAESSSRSMGGTAARYATTYFKTGDACWAQAFYHAMVRLDQLQAEEGAADDVRSCRYIFNEFDRIEEGAGFSEEQRRELSHIFYRFAQRLRYANATVKPSTTPHGNNWNAIGASYAGLYLTRYYPQLELGRSILDKLDVYYAPNMRAWKVNEDCPGYGNITFRGNTDWALHRPVPGYVRDGLMARMADYDMLITNNLGHASGFGDFYGLGKDYLVFAYPLAGWLYRDGRYLWWWDHFGRAPAYGWVPPEVVPRVAPEELLGVAVAPLDEWIYNRTNYTPVRDFPREECFDKAAFRQGFEKNDAYLCLSGFGYGFHSHPDANAIINFTAQGETFLYDDGYMIPSLREHNTVTVVRDGWAANVPELARIQVRATFADAGLFASRLHDYNGLDWDRCVIWSRPGTFAVLDRLRAVTPGDYGLQCIWRTLGDADLEGRRWTSLKGDARFTLDVCTDAALSQKQSAGLSLNAKPFPLDRARALIQAQGGSLAAGDALHFANVFSGQASRDAALAPARSFAGGAGVLFHDGNDTVAAALGTVREIGPFGMDARLWLATPDSLVAGGMTQLRSGELSVLRLDAPCNVRVDFVTRQALVQTESPVRVYTAEGAAAGRQLTAGEHAVALPALGANSGGLLRQAIAALAEEKTGAVAAQSEATGPGGLEVLWRYTDFAVYRDFAEGKGVSVSVNCTPFEPDQAGYPVGDPPDLLHADGNVMFPDGETVVVNIDLQEPQDLIQVVVHSRQLKTFNGGCGVRKLTVGVGSSADGSDVRTLASRSIDEELPNAKVTYAIDLPEGTRGRLVRITAEPYSSDHNVYLDSIDVNGKAGRTDIAGSGFHLNDLAVADLDGDGADDILAAGTDRAVHAVDSEGTRQWMQRLPDTVNALALFRSAPGTRPSVAAACDNHQLYAFDAAGAEVWSIKPPPRTYARAGYRGVKPFTGRLTVAFAADLEKDGADEILVGSANWRVYCFAADGTLKWDECCWAHTPTCGTACDLDGDGTLEVIMGNSYTSTQIYSTDGKLLGTGRGSSHAGPTALACADTDHNGKAEMVVGDKAGRIWFQEWEGRKMPDYNTGMDISAVTMHDLDGDGQQETLVASQNFLLYAFGPDGQPLWRRNLLDACRDIQCGDVTGDGKPNIVLACEDGTVRVLDAEGNAVALFKAGGWMRQVRIVDLDGDPKTYELVAACDDGSLYALQMTR